MDDDRHLSLPHGCRLHAAGPRPRRAGGGGETSREAVGKLLAEESRQPGFVPDAEMESLHGGDSTFTILQSDADGLTLMLAKFSALEATPVHDHGSWGVACVVRGRDRYRQYRVDDTGTVSFLYEKELTPGA